MLRALSDGAVILMVEKVRKALRRTSGEFDEEIEALIMAAYDDLQTGGYEASEPDAPLPPLVERGITVYCKAHFGFCDDADRYAKIYEQIKCTLSIADIGRK